MFVKFEKLKFKNILSYGNKWTELDFSGGLNLIKAQNGSGKSTILDAINFCLFGKPFRNIKMGQLINKYNGKDLLVEMQFSVNNDKYKILRGLKPNVFELSKNGAMIDSLSSKRLNQDEIDKLIGINERLFKNIVGIAVTNNKPFLSMSIGDKRALIESIFNIDVLSMMGREVKKRDGLNKSEQRLKLAELSGLRSNEEDNKKYIEKIKEYIDKFDETKKKDEKNLMNSIDECEKNVKIQMKHIADGNAAIENLQNAVEQPSNEEFSKVSSEIGSTNHEIHAIKSTLEKIDGVAVCPICGEKLDDERAVSHFNELKERLRKINDEVLPCLLRKQEELNAKKKRFDEINERINFISRKVMDENIKYKSNMNHLSSLKAQLEICKNRVCDFDTTENQIKLDDLHKSIEKINEELKVLEHKILIDNKLIDILGDEGLRMYFFKKLLPIFNQRINHYLHKFELQVQIEFNPYMEEKITTGRFEQNYNQFSGGEKSRIDMAILLSFFDISKMISNWSCSILFIDEVMDAGVDVAGTEQFLSTLYNIVTENNKSLGIYLISHKLSDVQVNWNEVIEIEKKSLFSEMKKSS